MFLLTFWTYKNCLLDSTGGVHQCHGEANYDQNKGFWQGVLELIIWLIFLQSAEITGNGRDSKKMFKTLANH